MPEPTPQQVLNTMAAHLPDGAREGVREIADAIRQDLPDLDENVIGRVMLTAFAVLAFIAQEQGDVPGPAGAYLSLGGAVAAELAAPENTRELR